jgi:hypothetical protein
MTTDTRWYLIGLLLFTSTTGATRPACAAIEPRNILKTYFETGDVPTQEQFKDLIDSYIHQTDDGLTLYAIGAGGGSTGSDAMRVGKNVGINEALPDTTLHVWRPVSLPLPQMCPEFCGTSGFLPLKYEDTSGQPHYGFLQIDMGTDPGGSPGAGIFVTQWVWESSANTTLTTFAVPEPTSAAWILLACSLAYLRRGRRQT